MFKVIEFFSGIGAQAQALKKLGANYEVVGTSEILKYSQKAYDAIHGKVKRLGDVTTIKERGALPLADMWTYSFPCQDISEMGLQRGLTEGSGTRSSLVYYIEDLLKSLSLEQRPYVLVLENVEALKTQFTDDLTKWKKRLDALGYNNYDHIYNSADYGIPQERLRLIMVSIRRDRDVREYSDSIYKGFIAPQKQTLNYTLSDFLEEDTPEVLKKYKAEDKFKEDIQKRYNAGIPLNGVEQRKIQQIKLTTEVEPYKQRRRVILETGVAPTLVTTGGHGTHKILRVLQKEKDPNSLLTSAYVAKDYLVRFLTPKECWRLMGFDDEAYEKAKGEGLTDACLYKQAGNSIVVNVLYYIFKAIIDAKGPDGLSLIPGATYDLSKTDAEKLKLDFLK